jgi:hypothetical protein
MSTVQLTDAEIETLRKGATGAGLLVAVSDRGFFDTFKEAGALAKHIASAREKSDSELVRRVSEGRGTGFGVTDSPSEIEAEATQALREGSQLLASKAPEEREAYRTFVLELAQSVASAAGGGDEAETVAIEKVRAALA